MTKREQSLECALGRAAEALRVLDMEYRIRLDDLRDIQQDIQEALIQSEIDKAFPHDKPFADMLHSLEQIPEREADHTEDPMWLAKYEQENGKVS